MSSSKSLGLWSGVGLVVANMVGAGVFLSTGFMAQSMTPTAILFAWLVGAVLALAGARAYAEVARLVPAGGGEYRYLSTLWHPALGYLAGWASLLVGFSAPIALDALAAGAFARAVWPGLEPRIFAAALVVILTAVHAFGLHLSTRVQNVLVAVKIVLLVGFVTIGLALGEWSFPAWQPPSLSGMTPGGFAGSLFFIAFAFSGWNAAIYAADEFKSPARDVPRAMLLGCLSVGVLYMVVNYIFVANLTPSSSTVVFGYSDFTSLKSSSDSVTLGQAVMARLLGPEAAEAMSLMMLVLFISAMSAMTMVGPRVYAAMARDGFLPKWLAGTEGRSPRGAVVLQGLIALVVLFTHELRTVLSNVGAILVFFAALTVSGLFAQLKRAKTPDQKPSVISLVAAGVYVLSAVLMLYFGFRENLSLLQWVAGVSIVAFGAWALTRVRQKARTEQAAP